MSTEHPLREAIRIVGAMRLARELGLTYQAVQKWLAAGRMPRTEWTGETDYCARIAELTAGAVTRDKLLASWPAPDAPPAVPPGAAPGAAAVPPVALQG